MIKERFLRIKITDQWDNCLPRQMFLRDWYKVKYKNWWATSSPANSAAFANVSISHAVFLSSLKGNDIFAFVMNMHRAFHTIKSNLVVVTLESCELLEQRSEGSFLRL